jgi:phage tail-like protein
LSGQNATLSRKTAADLLSHVAQPHRCYVGDEVKLVTRVVVSDTEPSTDDRLLVFSTLRLRKPKLLTGQPGVMPTIWTLPPHKDCLDAGFKANLNQPLNLNSSLAWAWRIVRRVDQVTKQVTKQASIELETTVQIAPNLYVLLGRYLLEQGGSPELELDRERHVEAESRAHLLAVANPQGATSMPSVDGGDGLEQSFWLCLKEWWDKQLPDSGQVSPPQTHSEALRDALWEWLRCYWQPTAQHLPNFRSKVSATLLKWLSVQHTNTARNTQTQAEDQLAAPTTEQSILSIYANGLLDQLDGSPEQASVLFRNLRHLIERFDYKAKQAAELRTIRRKQLEEIEAQARAQLDSAESEADRIKAEQVLAKLPDLLSAFRNESSTDIEQEEAEKHLTIQQAIRISWECGLAKQLGTTSIAFERALLEAFDAWMQQSPQPITASASLEEKLWIGISGCLLTHVCGILRNGLEAFLRELPHSLEIALPQSLRKLRDALIETPNQISNQDWSHALPEYLALLFPSRQHTTTHDRLMTALLTWLNRFDNTQITQPAQAAQTAAKMSQLVSKWSHQTRTEHPIGYEAVWIESLLNWGDDLHLSYRSSRYSDFEARFLDQVQWTVLSWLAETLHSGDPPDKRADAERIFRVCVWNWIDDWSLLPQPTEQKMQAANVLGSVVMEELLYLLGPWTQETTHSQHKQDTLQRLCITPKAQDRTSLSISLMSGHMRYLPALYRQANNDLLGRFMLGNEGLVSRMEKRLEHLHAYFDPMLAPKHLLPWLAAWGGEPLDARWSEQQQRALLRYLLLLQRTRGTPTALQNHIALYIGHTPRIEEQRSGNLLLGSAARLGESLALGRTNQAHTFTVYLPAAHFQNAQTKAVVQSLIEWHKPAHTCGQIEEEQPPKT